MKSDQSNNREFIYSLVHYREGKKIVFYVGRSEREPGVRFHEHWYAANSDNSKHDTSVYRYIREKVMAGIFEEEILCWADPDVAEDHEDFYVIQMIRRGEPLQNEKHGDLKRLALIDEAYVLNRDSVKIETVDDLREYRSRVTADKASALRAKILAEEGTPSQSLMDFIASVPKIVTKKPMKRIKKLGRRKK
jgi:hypothetical protein